MPEEEAAGGGESGADRRLDKAVEACGTEFLRDDFFDREVPTARVLALLRLRFLITSVLRDKGRTTPCSLRNSPQALHNGWPSGLRRHRGVVCVKQLVQVVGPALDSPFLGLAGRDGPALLRPPPPDSGGVSGDVLWFGFMPWRSSCAVLGVDVVRAIF